MCVRLVCFHRAVRLWRVMCVCTAALDVCEFTACSRLTTCLFVFQEAESVEDVRVSEVDKVEPGEWIVMAIAA